MNEYLNRFVVVTLYTRASAALSEYVLVILCIMILVYTAIPFPSSMCQIILIIIIQKKNEQKSGTKSP